MSQPEVAPGSRRRLLLGAAAGLAAALELSGCGGTGKASTPPISGKAPGARNDARLLNQLLAAEYYGIAAYTAATPRLEGRNGVAAKQFLGQELLHADRLINLIGRLGGNPHRAKASYDLGHPASTSDLVRLLLAAEYAQLRSYRAIIPKLSQGSLRQKVVSVFAVQAQHAAVWRLQLGRPPAPSAFVNGREAS